MRNVKEADFKLRLVKCEHARWALARIRLFAFSSTNISTSISHLGGVGIAQSAATAMEYRLDAREPRARTELEWVRYIVHSLGYSLPLVSYAFEAHLRETGILHTPISTPHSLGLSFP